MTRVDGSMLELVTTYSGLVLDIPREATATRDGDTLRLAWRQELPQGGFSAYRLALSPQMMFRWSAPSCRLPDGFGVLHLEDLTGKVRETDALEIGGVALAEGRRYVVLFRAHWNICCRDVHVGRSSAPVP